jgi:hypothetical protein
MMDWDGASGVTESEPAARGAGTRFALNDHGDKVISCETSAVVGKTLKLVLTINCASKCDMTHAPRLRLVIHSA